MNDGFDDTLNDDLDDLNEGVSPSKRDHAEEKQRGQIYLNEMRGKVKNRGRGAPRKKVKG